MIKFAPSLHYPRYGLFTGAERVSPEARVRVDNRLIDISFSWLLTGVDTPLSLFIEPGFDGHTHFFYTEGRKTS